MYSVDQEQIEKENKPFEVDVHPISKWKRILIYLGDMMLTFICCFVLFNVAVYPLSTVIVKYDSESSILASQDRDDVLYENKLLFYKDDYSEKYDYTDNLKYTFNRFLAYYTFESGECLTPDVPEYSHLPENEIIATYFLTIKGDSTTYTDIYKEANAYFDVDGTNVTLKQEIKNIVKYYFDPNEKLESETYQNMSNIFASLFAYITKDIAKNDLTYTKADGSVISYNESQAIIDNNYKVFSWRMTVGVLIAHLLSVGIVYFVYPLINKRRRTPLMSIFKADRIGRYNLKHLLRRETVLQGAYSFILSLPYTIFIPLSYTDVFTLISLPLLLSFFIVSLVLVIVGLVITLVTPFNQSLVDLLTRSVIVSGDDIDAIDRAKSYGK